MSYLAEKKIMHGDLAARNILMSEDPLKRKCPLAKVADFGLDKKFYSNEKYRKASRMCVPWKWMAIEYLKDDYFTLKSDVWSFAVLIWEILSFGREPYGHQDYDQILTNLEQGYRLPFPESSKNCLSFDLLPSFEITPPKIMNSLSEIIVIECPLLGSGRKLSPFR